MNKYKSETSMNVSSQISKYILNKARDLYINRLRTEAIQQKSLEINKSYPTQCTLKMIELSKFLPNQTSPRLYQDLELIPPAKCRDINGSSVKTTCASSPRVSTKTYTNCRTTIRNERKQNNNTILANRTFLPLISSQEEDQEIQILRQKKQKIEILEKFFDQSQKKQKNKLKQKITETINNTFTTDFNGEKIEMKSTKRKKTVDPYMMIEMEANLSEQRSENKLNLNEGRNIGGIKKTTKLSEINNIYRQELSKGRASKLSKNVESLQFRQIQNLINRENTKKSYLLNRKSRLKIMPELMSINFIKCLQDNISKQFSCYKFYSKMDKLGILQKLPAYFRNTPNLFKISQLIAKSSVGYSALLINEKEQNYLLLKEGNIYVKEDWQAFSLLRASSRLLISSGENLRKEKDIFKTRQGYGNQNVQDLNQALIGKEKQKVFIFTKSLTIEKLKPLINEQLYDLIQLPQYKSVYDALDILLKSQQNLPMTLEVGIDVLNQYFNEVNKGHKNKIDTLLLSKFSGQNISKYKGSKFTIPLDKYYNMQWRSEDYSCKLSNGEQGKLNFEVYVPKQT